MQNYSEIVLLVTSGLLALSLFFVKRLIKSIDDLAKTVQGLREDTLLQDNDIQYLKKNDHKQNVKISNNKEFALSLEKKIIKLESKLS